MMNEENLNKEMERKADEGFAKYREQVEALESKSVLSKARSISEADVVALTKQLDNWKLYEAWCNETGNINKLGNLPNIALDVITAVYGTSPLAAVASVQPIEEMHGLVYFKQLLFENAKGNMSAGEVGTDPRTGSKTPSGYASNSVEGEVLDTANGVLTNFTGVLAAKPIILQSLVVTVQDDAAVYCEDVGVRGSDSNVGTLLGSGVSGTINYITGAIELDFAVAPADTKEIYLSYQENYELNSDIPKISSFMDSKQVKAKVYALKGTMGMIQSFAMQKRWGKSLDEDVAMDIVAEINKEIFGDVIAKLKGAAQGTTAFSRTLPTGVGKNEHFESFKYSINDAESVMIGNAGRGGVNVIIAGRNMCALLQGLRDFELLSDAQTLGPHIFGKYRGRIVIRVPEEALLAADNGIALFKGQSVFEAACSYSPYMPLATTDAIPEAPNPLVNQRAAATVAAVESLVPQFATNLNVTA
jgi:hypothetical protein